MASLRNYTLTLNSATPIAVKGITTLWCKDDVRIAYNKPDLDDGSGDYAVIPFSASGMGYTFDAGAVQTTLWVTCDPAPNTTISVNNKQGQQGE